MADDTFKPNAEMATNAERALRWLKEGHAGSGFTDVGRARAVQLSNRENLSLETVKRMYSFFSRHEVDKKGKDFDNLSKPSAGRVAWDAWGGDAGYRWAKRIVESRSDKADMSDTKASLFARIIKADKQADGTLLVTGIATDDSLDVDDQICDPEWLKGAMPDWFRWGNIREQHSNIAAGVATEYEAKGSQHWITARVVDPASVKKVESGVLKGFSIGIRQPRVVKDNKAAGGRIVDGQIVEVSLVDRPANPVCTLALAKAVNGELTPIEELIEKEMMMEESTAKAEETMEESTAKAEMTAEESTAKAEESTAEGSVAPRDEMTEESTKEYAMEESTTVKEAMCKECGKAEGECKCAEGGYSETEKAAEESSQEVSEESSQAIGEESSREGGVAGVAGKSVDDRLTHIEEMLTVLIGKFADVDATEGIAKSVDEITERLSVVEKSARVNAPVRMAVGEPKPPVDENIAKAEQYRAKAMAATDPVLAKGYLTLAMELESTLNK